MERAYVKNKQEAWLVEGSIGGIRFNGHGRPFAFKQKDADLLCESFGFTQQAADSTEQPDKDFLDMNTGEFSAGVLHRPPRQKGGNHGEV